MVKVKEDMTGWVMAEHGVPDSRLTVIKQVEDYVSPKGHVLAQWLCECSCEEHNKILVTGSALRTGQIRSCGCLTKESAKQNGKNNIKYNKYNLNGECGVGWTSNTNQEFYFDLEDYEKIKDYCWFEHISTTGYHSICTHNKQTGEFIKMHYIIADKYCDHKNRNPRDNRKNNLRKATHQENMRNKKRAENNKSGFTGVCWSKYHNRWRAFIAIDKKKQTHLGYFKNKEDAIRARLKAEAIYFKEFAPQRHLFEQYQINIEEEINE